MLGIGPFDQRPHPGEILCVEASGVLAQPHHTPHHSHAGRDAGELPKVGTHKPDHQKPRKNRTALARLAGRQIVGVHG